jgi:AcrR family transcriptional regulator
MKKESVRLQILQSVVALDVSKGHLKWRVSDLARAAKVSRPLIYYHFGKSKSEILKNCLEMIAEDYYGLTAERTQMLAAGQVGESLLKTRQIFLKNPALAVFYQKWRTQNSPFQKQLIEIERRYHDKLKKVFPQLSTKQILAIHGIFHGLVTAPFLNDESIREALSMVNLFQGDRSNS